MGRESPAHVKLVRRPRWKISLVSHLKGSPIDSQKNLKINDDGHKSLSYLMSAPPRLHPKLFPDEQLISEQTSKFQETVTDSRLPYLKLLGSAGNVALRCRALRTTRQFKFTVETEI